MEAYFDEKLKRWVFPGDDLAQMAKPLPPPPITVFKEEVPVNSLPPSIEQVKVIYDPLSMLMAPPTIRKSGVHGFQKGAGSNNSTPTNNPVIPQFSVFQAKSTDHDTAQPDREAI